MKETKTDAATKKGTVNKKNKKKLKVYLKKIESGNV